MATGAQTVKAAGLALAVNIVVLWMLSEYLSVKAPDYVGQATGIILTAVFVYVAPFLPKGPAA